MSVMRKGGYTSVSSDNAGSFSGLPFPSNAECDETASISTDKISLPPLDLVAPRLAFGELSKSGF